MSETKRRRGHHEGSPVHRKDGRWEWRVTMPNGGPRKSFYGRTQKEARAKALRAVQDYEAGIDSAAGKITVAAYLDRWLADSAANRVRPTTLRLYRHHLDKHVKPAIGSVRLLALTPHQVNRALAQMVDDGLAPSTTNRIRAILSSALNAAVRSGLLMRNVATLSEPRRAAKTRREPLTIDQVKALLAGTKDDRYGPLWHVAIASGAREGELLALRWQDAELERGVLHIRHTLTRYGGAWHFSEPKTEGSRRDVKLTPGAVEALARQQVKLAELEMAAATRWQENGLIFPSSVGTPQHPQPVRAALHKALERLGLPDQRFHDLRHCTATLLLAEGVDIFTVKEVLGHSSIAMTGDIYGHLTRKLADEAAARLERAMTQTPALDAKSDARAD